MKKIIAKISINILLLSVLTICSAVAQEMYPGDANDNGIANGVDLIYLGKAFGETGDARADQGIDFSPKLFSPWAGMFPDGLNFAHADSDGNGIIEAIDKDAINQNYGLTHDPIMPDEYAGDGLPLLDPSLVLLPAVPSVLPGQTVDVPVFMGTLGLPVTNFQGVTFSVLYDSDMVTEPVVFNQLPSFVDPNPGSETINLVTNNEPGVTNVAITRINDNEIAGFGQIGTLSFIIIEDFVTALPADTLKIILDSVLLLDQNLEPHPLVLENAEVLVLPDTTTSTFDWDPAISMNIFPNPITTQRIFTIDNKGFPIKKVELINTFGQAIPLTDDAMAVFKILDSACPPGVYFLKIETPKGIVTEKLILQ